MRFWRIVTLVLAPLPIPALYRDVARNWGGIGLIYLFMLFTLAWLPTLIKMHLTINKFSQEEFPKFAKQVPEVKVKNGKVSSPVPQPFEIRDETGKLIFVLDTTGKINNLEQTEALILVTETKFHQRDPQQGKTQVQDLNGFPDFDVSPEIAQEWMDRAATWAAPACYPVFMIGSFIRALVIMFLASIVGLIFNGISGNGVSFGGLLRLGAVGLTLSVWVDTGLDIAHWLEATDFRLEFPWWFLIALGTTCMYVAFGVLVAGKPKLPGEEDMDDYRDRPRRAPRYDDEPRGGDTGIKREPGYD